MISLLTAAVLAAGAGAESLPARQDVLVVKARKLYTAAGPMIENGVVVCADGKIRAVGEAGSIELPQDARVLEAAVCLPGLVDAHSVVGLAGWLNQDHDQDQLERSAPIQPELRAIDAYNPREALISWVRSFGVTTVHTGHAPGQVVSGQTLIAKTVGETVEEAVFVPFAMVAATLGDGATTEGKAPGTRSKAVAMLRQELVNARAYADRLAAGGEKEPDRNLRLESLAAVLAGDVPLLVTAHRAHDLAAALRLREEFGIRMVLDGASESYLLLEELKQSGVPVLCHPPMARARGETQSLTMETPHLLQQAGVPVALQSGYESYVPKTRVVLFEAAIAARYGCTFEDALRLVTIDAAKLLGIADRVGSLEVGKDADLALYDGDPFEYTTHCTGVLIDGNLVSQAVR